ncbi:3-oxoacyl-[acyl-carrier-protein] synthase III C-terminal domain-containing protein [Streptomyces sp. NPDC051976]|uniref:3-oxoacyl-[acyl-carrier-protein] synthase III C-terminal domain-containing protein n=1 Tax=Streptomyces sp. NPDC051976 TaxID=3154947 RepID=UPI0034323642
MQPVGIVDFGSYLPEKVVGPEFFLDEDSAPDPMANSPLFKVPPTRHHVAPDEQAADMIAKAARPVFERLGRDPAAGVDVLITNVLLPDELFTGIGARAAHRLGMSPGWIVDLHNGGCAAFMYMVQLARKIMADGTARTALIADVTNSAGQMSAQSEVRKQPHAAIPGDGCGVAYLEAGKGSPVLGVDAARHFDTFDRFGNLYGAAVPINLDHALRDGRLHDGDLVMMSGFAHAGDFAAAAAVRWSAAA